MVQLSPLTHIVSPYERDRGVGIIVSSESEWAAPIVLVAKKDRSLQLCVDYRRLNLLSKADTYPMPSIEELINGLGKAKYLFNFRPCK